MNVYETSAGSLQTMNWIATVQVDVSQYFMDIII